METSDAELMARTREGDQEAFTLIVDRWKDRVVNYLCRLTGDRDRAEDTAQETFLRLYRTAAGYREEGHLAAFIFRIATNLARSEERRNRRWRIFRATVPADGNGHGRPPTPQAQLLQQEVSEQLAVAIAGLPLKFRAPLMLREIEGLSYQAIAAATGCREGTVKSRINRGRQQLRQQLAPYWNGGTG
ncbi:MAG: sigma-70 family RNA polymerase sigma factor [bacterium]|nr:sigma-70 family RNA polymerase sigma factor [bacterium]